MEPKIIVEKTKIKPVMGMQTLVGYLYQGPPPYKEGNCFSFFTGYDEKGIPMSGPRCINMRDKNAKILFKDIKDELEVTIFHIDSFKEGTWCIVTDKRVPDEWKTSKVCPICVPEALRSYLSKSESEKETEE